MPEKKRVALGFGLRITLLAVAAALTAGCTSQVAIPVQYTPVKSVAALPAKLHGAKILVVRAIDARQDKQTIGRSSKARMHAVGDVPALVSSAIVDGLKKAGAQAAVDAQFDRPSYDGMEVPAAYDYVLVPRLNKFMSTIEMGWSQMHCDGTVEVQYQLAPRGARADSTSPWRGPIVGLTKQDVDSQVYYIEVRDFMDAALQNLVLNLVEDLRSGYRG